MVRARSSRHAVKEWDSLVREDVKHPNVSHIPTVNVGDATVPVAPRLGLPGSGLSDCLTVEVDLALPRSRTDMEFHNDSSLRSVAPQLFNMEPRSQSEKTLNIELNLYQMENY